MPGPIKSDNTMFIPDHIIIEIKDRSLIQDVIAHYVSLKKEGKDLKGICPFCNEKKLTVSPSKQIYKCWHCEKGGNNAITFITDKENLDYPGALKWLADFYHIHIPDPAPAAHQVQQQKPVKQKKDPEPVPLAAGTRSGFLKATMRSIGLSREMNQVSVKWENRASQSETIPLLQEDPAGNIEFLVYDINGFVVTHQKQTKEGLREVPYKVIRLKEPQLNTKDGKMMKYIIPKGVGTRPFFPPALLDKYAQSTVIDTLFITEGYKKAISGWINGIDIVGLASITTYRDKETMQLHRDIIELILRCKVKNVVILYDGDCSNISTTAFQEEKDISARPKSFFSSATGIKELLKDYLKEYEISLYFAHINTESVEGHPKGLDDIYEAMIKVEFNTLLKQQSDEQTNMQKGRLLQKARKSAVHLLNTDLLAFSKGKVYFTKINISLGVKKLEQHLALENSTSFYLRHQEIILERPFIYFGSQWKYNTEKGECEMIFPAASKNYQRVGDHYFENVYVPNKHKDLEKQLHRRAKTTISDDHGKAFMKHIQKFKSFCNIPDHTNYQEVVSNCYNIYSRFEWEPEEGECPMTLNFLRHIFQDHYELGLDYLQLLFQRPTQILPILCLVSKENNTGKTTFAKWLKQVYRNNMAIVGNADLSNDFNGFWSNKLIICCDEAFIDKKVVVEKIKSLSTADRITMNQKGIDQVEIEFFGKFIMLSNNEENFIYATEEDIRYWVLKIKKPEKEVVDLLSMMIAEIPHFLYYLSARTMSTSSESRMWFRASLLETEALEKVRKNSQSTLEKEIRTKMQSLFEDFSENIIMMTLSDIRKEFFNNAKYEEKYLLETLKERLKVDQWYVPDSFDPSQKRYLVRRYTYPKWQAEFMGGDQSTRRQDIRGHGRPFIFLRPDFVTPAREAVLANDPEFIRLATEVPEHYKRPGMLDTSASSPLRNNAEEDMPF